MLLSLVFLWFFPAFLLLSSGIFAAHQYFTCRRKDTTSLPPLPPGPKPWPVVGCIFEMVGKKPIFRWIHKIMDEMNTEIACIRIGNVYVIPVTSPELCCEFLKNQDSNFSSRPLCMSAELVSNGYLTTVTTPNFGKYRYRYKKMKKIIVSEILSSARHNWLRNKRDEEADHLLRYIYSHVRSGGGSVIKVRTFARHYCGNVIRKLIFNKRFFGHGGENGGPGVEEKEHVDAISTLLTNVYAFGVSDYMPSLKVFDIGGHRKILKKALKSVSKYQDPEIDERIKIWEKGLKTNQEDLLDVLITVKDDNGKALLSSEGIKAQITELMIATVDNPSNVVEWALAEMLNQPETLEKAVEELDTVVRKDKLIQESDIPHLNYIKACLTESFRLHPIAPFNVPHVSVKDTTVAGFFFPKGSNVILSRQGLGRNPRIWDDPLKFKPERHLHGVSCNQLVNLMNHDFHFISFSSGRHACLGILLGSTITIMLFSRILQGFNWNIPGDVSKIDLAESESNLFLSKPLEAIARPRLADIVYPPYFLQQ